MALLSEAEKQRIGRVIAEIETRTAGEIVVSVVGRSDDYAGPRIAYAALAALMAAAVAHVIFVDLDATWLLGAQPLLAVAAFFVLGTPRVLRLVVPRELMREKVEQRAERAFLEQGVFRTRDRSGVLLLLSELEHRAVMLGDEGIHARVQTAGWQGHVDQIVRAIKEARAADGVCEVLSTLGDVLARDFPVRHDDADELPNAVVERER